MNGVELEVFLMKGSCGIGVNILKTRATKAFFLLAKLCVFPLQQGALRKKPEAEGVTEGRSV